MTAHLFADETKERGFVLVAAVVLPEDLARMRGSVSALRQPGQRRLHFSGERDAHRRRIIGEFAAAPVSAVVYDATACRDQKMARDAAVARLADDAAKIGAAMLILERDDSVADSDRRILRERLTRAGCQGSIRYELMRAHEEPLLAIPDAVAWCYARDAVWRRRIECLITEVVRL